VEHYGVSLVVLWQQVLGTIGIFNLCVWALVAVAISSRRPDAHTRRQLLLSAIFVAGCAFRSFFPRADVQRIVLHDGPISSVFVGRSVATVAELAFVAQCALFLYALGRKEGSRPVTVIAGVLVPLIVVAEICSWYAVLTTNYLGNAVEDSVWALGAALSAAAFLLLYARRRRIIFACAAVVFLAYAGFNGTVDVPNYVHRWLQDQQAGRVYLALGAGLHDSAERWVVTRDWSAWRNEIAWMSLYFSVGVWISIGLAWLSRVDLSAAPARTSVRDEAVHPGDAGGERGRLQQRRPGRVAQPL
jgi:hypothetical protein